MMPAFTSMSRLIDLSYTYDGTLPVHPGDLIPEVRMVGRLVRDGFNTYELKSGMHVGTHIDAPLYFIEHGRRISDYPIERFMGPAHLIDVRGLAQIGEGVLASYPILPGDSLLLFTGHSKFITSSDYYETFPVLTEGFARAVVALDINMLGMDSPTTDRAPYTVHKILLQHDILIIKNLMNLVSLFSAKTIELIAFPPKFALEGAFLRAVAKIEE